MEKQELFLLDLKGNKSKYHIKVSYFSKNILDLAQVKKSEEAFAIFNLIWDHDLIGMQEQFYALYFNSQHRLLGWRLISTGSVHTIVVNIKLIVALALHSMASYVIVAHNHPSGLLSESVHD